MLAGDTVPCAGLDELCRGADIYVQTVLRDDLVNLVPMQRFRDTIDYHSTVVQAAQTARAAGVRTLVLTHQIPTPAAGAADEWIAIAASTSPARSCSAKTYSRSPRQRARVRERQSRKFVKSRGTPKSCSRNDAIAFWRSSRFLPVTRSWSACT